MTANEPIECKAAVCWKPNGPLVLEDVIVAPPQDGEVRVRMIASSVCHTDEYTRSGNDPVAQYPCILGHEGAGIVESVGPDVTTVKPGDHVIPCFNPQCNMCSLCKSGKTNICPGLRPMQIKGFMPNGTSRFTSKRTGETISHFMNTSTFSQYTVVPEICIAKINPTAPLDKVGLFGCGIPTGYGAVVNTMKVEKGATVAVFGLGAVGLAAIMGAKFAGARIIIAVDTNPAKFAKAMEFGATACVNPKDTPDTPIQHVLFGMTIEDGIGGLDYTFECIGKPETMQAAFESCHLGWGKCCVVGIADGSLNVKTNPINFTIGFQWMGTTFGGYKPRDAIPKLVEMYLKKEIKVDEFITHHFKLSQMNEAFSALHDGECIRSIINMNVSP